MPLENRNLIQRVRQALYRLKREYGGTIDIYKLNSSDTDVRTGVKVIDKTVYRVERAIVMPARRDRTVARTVSQEFNMGGSFDDRVRDFIIDRRDLPNLPDLTSDDWIVYRSGKYQIQEVVSYELDTGWIITAKELVGEVPEQIFLLSADLLLAFSTTTLTE